MNLPYVWNDGDMCHSTQNKNKIKKDVLLFIEDKEYLTDIFDYDNTSKSTGVRLGNWGFDVYYSELGKNKQKIIDDWYKMVTDKVPMEDLI